jgi:ABC-2 type transport system permease protein
VRNINIAIISCAVIVVPLCFFYVVIKDSFAGLFAKIILKLALFDRFEFFIGGIFDIGAIVYYLSIIAFFVFLSVRSMEKHRFN